MSQDWDAAMREAIGLAQSPDAPYGENPRVGCVILDGTGAVVGRGYHRGAGTPHAEVMALLDAGPAAAGATAVVSLEPCRHTGRTGPCAEALIASGVAAVVFGQSDPTIEAGGGGDVLRRAGVATVGGVLLNEAEKVNEAWTFAVRRGRPLVTLKLATSLDGRVAGADGGPTALTGAPALRAVHELRAVVGAIIVGTGTALADDPALTVRLGAGEPTRPPIRVVMGSRASSIPADSRVRDGSAPTLLLTDRDPASVLAHLYAQGVRHALLEGGPTLAAAFLRDRLVDRIEWFIAPVVLGAGPGALPAGCTEDGAPVGVDVDGVCVIGEDVRVSGKVEYERVGL